MAQVVAMFGIETQFEILEPNCITGTISLGDETCNFVKKENSIHFLNNQKNLPEFCETYRDFLIQIIEAYYAGYLKKQNFYPNIKVGCL